MTREEMLKISWRAYMEIYYKHPRSVQPTLCLLVEIDFDEETLTLQPLHGSEYVSKDFYAAIQHCSIPPKKMKAEVINGKKIKNNNGVHPYEGSDNTFNPYFTYENLNPNSAS